MHYQKKSKNDKIYQKRNLIHKEQGVPVMNRLKLNPLKKIPTEQKQNLLYKFSNFFLLKALVQLHRLSININ